MITLERFIEPEVEHEFSKGMLVTLSCHSSEKSDLVNKGRRIYRTFMRGIQGPLMDKEDRLPLPEGRIEVGNLPREKSFMELLNRKTPVMALGIHSFDIDGQPLVTEMRDYCHIHLFVFGAHWYLPEEGFELRDRINYTEKMLHPLTKRKEHQFGPRGRSIDVRPVGQDLDGVPYPNDNIHAATLYSYLRLPKTNPEMPCAINYVAGMEAPPCKRVPLMFIYKKIQ